MKFPKLEGIKRVLQKARQAVGRDRSRFAGDAPLFIPGQFQTYSYTLPDRYPWLFQFAAESLAKSTDLHLLSFGCSRGDEVFALRKYFPTAVIKRRKCCSRRHGASKMKQTHRSTQFFVWRCCVAAI
jgi:hypothetical protein